MIITVAALRIVLAHGSRPTAHVISLLVSVNNYSNLKKLYNRAGSNGSHCVEPPDLIKLETFQ
jgi:hypothetical protein